MRVISVGLMVVVMAGVLGAAPPAAAPQGGEGVAPVRTKAEVDKMIEEAGKAAPAWWDSTALNYPSTLDLSWKKVGKWNSQTQMDAYLWDIVYPNPAKWHEGVKLAQQSIAANKGNAAVMQKASGALADMYTSMLQDYARGAYWAKKNGTMQMIEAECYAKLGSKDGAKEVLNKLGRDDTFNAVSVKLWSEMGELKTALAWADDIADEGRAAAAHVAAGDACRRVGDISKATEYYKMVMAETSNPQDKNRKRAQANLDVIQLFENLDLGKVADGTYKDSSAGYVGPLEVAVTVKGHRIEKVEVVSHKEKQFYASLTEVPPQIVAKQSVKGIDTTTGATITSEAIINASAKALRGGQK